MISEKINSKIPDYASDLRTNLETVLSQDGAPGLTTNEILSIALASAMTSPSLLLKNTIQAEAEKILSPNEITGAKSAFAIMSMTNIYYRFLHISNNTEYQYLPPQLQRSAESNADTDKKSFELASLAVSAINNCKACVDFHELSLRRMGYSALSVQSCVRIASVIKAVGEILRAEEK